MPDQELLKLAAKAAGKASGKYVAGLGLQIDDPDYEISRDKYWNPLADDGDALRLAVRLDIDLEFQCPGVEAYRSYNHPACCESDRFCAAEHGDDPYAAARRAIVRAAAEIGRAMP